MPFTTRYMPKKISQISESDSKVAIIGKVIDVGEDSFILDDDTGKVEIATDIPVEKDSLLRVFCSMVDGHLKADVVQDLKGLDLNLYKRIEELYNKSGV
jgi:hypothetical protein